VNDPGGGTLFETPEQFLAYMKTERPRLYRLIAKTHVVPGMAPSGLNRRIAR
jgi:hypothetical protein